MEAYTASTPVFGRRASYKITLGAGYLRAELHNQGTAEEMQMFLNTVARTGKVLECGRFLISVHTSIPMSTLEWSSFFGHLSQLGASPAHKVAVLGHALHPGAAAEYIAPFAQCVNVLDFADEAEALQWVRNRRHTQDRRYGQDLRFEQHPRLGQDRRYGQVNEWRI